MIKHRRLPGIVLARILLVIVSAGIAEQLPAADYDWDFRNGHFDNLSLVPMGPGAVNLLRPSHEGLRITVPAGHSVKSVGFSPRFKIAGDFEITIEFTIIHRVQPQTGFGTGPSIYLSMGSTSDPAASLGRLLRPDGQDYYGVFAARVEDGRRIPNARLFKVTATGAQSGRLQLKRTGHEITYSVAEDATSVPRALATLPVSDAEVTLARIGISQSDTQSGAELILHAIRLDAAELPQLPSEQSRTVQLYRPRYVAQASPKSSRWLWQAVAALVITGGGTFWIWRRRQSSR